MVEVLRILSINGLATIQDYGRYGYRNKRVLVSGAMDKNFICL